ncbi:TIGR03571 family LLM class oxidoreductase [Serratia entomophila]|uniref:TIGR03571 family LLM class oxidoreductase n=1 Tax=Serratia entomophila TaxID=42906 RepID=A0ABY5CPS8_9GAMM|nr:TIGR03571 family LLM class oxidoreductase [Serratia entomophila]USV00133.1 TIGR03571 family LLM class oxidoreductase [Serratia entomophila]CAI0926381.1 luciferase-type oxidoreductase, BA3436 family [Serratia entomophila]CAI0934705.1 luciferase-type oxidoreductase, BA3436 family [Serratia entomophila]CAI0952999.1 luciferase-type oxidoreductase, BA3436 family [Serratia entomophila]CAI0955027.1 luciferase-type oxidoreductase, BA3436 family [Serratia entomophila]
MNIEKLSRGPLSIGVELPLDNDWSTSGQLKRQRDRRPFGVPDMTEHASLIALADKLGFRAAWVRDVPLYDPDFGDAAQVFETFTYLGYLSSLTRNILLGTAAVVLPLRQPWLVRKAAATLQTLSGDRLLLGVASGDRPVEYPLFGQDYATRGETFRSSVGILKGEADTGLQPGLRMLPANPPPPLLVAGLAQQTPEWVGKNMDGWLSYPGTPADHVSRVKLWRQVAGDKAYVSFIHLDLSEDANAPVQRHRFGIKTGRNGLIQELNAMQEAGVNHIGLHFRRNQRPLNETLMEIGQWVLPEFHRPQV